MRRCLIGREPHRLWGAAYDGGGAFNRILQMAGNKVYY